MKGVLWRGRRRGMERGKLWIGVWIRENERPGGGGGGGGSRGGRERKSGGKIKLQNFQILNYEREFHKILTNRGREIIVQPLKGCVFQRVPPFEEKF